MPVAPTGVPRRPNPSDSVALASATVAPDQRRTWPFLGFSSRKTVAPPIRFERTTLALGKPFPVRREFSRKQAKREHGKPPRRRVVSHWLPNSRAGRANRCRAGGAEALRERTALAVFRDGCRAPGRDHQGAPKQAGTGGQAGCRRGDRGRAGRGCTGQEARPSLEGPPGRGLVVNFRSGRCVWGW